MVLIEMGGRNSSSQCRCTVRISKEVYDTEMESIFGNVVMLKLTKMGLILRIVVLKPNKRA